MQEQSVDDIGLNSQLEIIDDFTVCSTTFTDGDEFTWADLNSTQLSQLYFLANPKGKAVLLTWALIAHTRIQCPIASAAMWLYFWDRFRLNQPAAFTAWPDTTDIQLDEEQFNGTLFEICIVLSRYFLRDFNQFCVERDQIYLAECLMAFFASALYETGSGVSLAGIINAYNARSLKGEALIECCYKKKRDASPRRRSGRSLRKKK